MESDVQLRGLHDDCIARGESWRDFPRREEQRKIPRNDGGDYSERFAQRVIKKWPAHGRSIAANFCGPARVVAKNFRNHRHIHLARFENWLAVVERFERAEVFVVFVDQVAHFPKNSSAIGGAHFGPRAGRIGFARGIDGGGNVLLAGFGESVSFSPVAGFGGAGFSGRRIRPFAADKKLAGLNIWERCSAILSTDSLLEMPLRSLVLKLLRNFRARANATEFR